MLAVASPKSGSVGVGASGELPRWQCLTRARAGRGPPLTGRPAPAPSPLQRSRFPSSAVPSPCQLAIETMFWENEPVEKADMLPLLRPG